VAAKTDLAAIAGDRGYAVNVAEPDYFGEVRTTAVGDAHTLKWLHDKHGQFVSAYLMDGRGRTYRTTRIGDVKKWMGVA
jgi:hypothetical protein